MPTPRPRSSSASLNAATIRSRSAAERPVGDEVVVVQAHSPGAGVGELVDGVDRVAQRAGRLAERVAARVADGPQAEREARELLGLRSSSLPLRHEFCLRLDRMAMRPRVIGVDVGTSSAKGVAIDEHGAVLAEAERRLSGLDAPPRLVRAGPRGLGGRHRGGPRHELGADGADGIGLTGQMHGLVALGADDRPLRPAILWNDGRSQPQATAIEQRAGDRAARRAQRQPRAGRLHRAQARAGWPSTSPTCTAGSPACCCPRTTSASGSPASWPPTSPTPRAPCCWTSPAARGAPSWPRRSPSTPPGCRPSTSPTTVTGHTAARRAGGRRRRRPGGGRARRRRHRRRRPRVAGARHQRRHLRRAQTRYRPRPAGPAARLLPRAARPLARDGRDPVGRRAR